MMQSNLKIAITGGIGSGKSTVASIVSEQGYSVISCDKVYGQLLENETFIKQLSSEFGDILNYGKLDRKKLAEIVFCDKKKLQRLNEITHPLIMKSVFKQMSGEKIAFCEVPLLFEKGYEEYFDAVIVVLRDKGERIKSVVERDNISEESVLLRINSQFDYENADFSKCYVIHNTLDIVDLRNKTIKIINELKKKYKLSIT